MDKEMALKMVVELLGFDVNDKKCYNVSSIFTR